MSGVRFLAAVAVGIGCFTTSACAQQEANGDERFAVPENADTERLLKFIGEVQEVRPTDLDELKEMQAALGSAADQILADKQAGDEALQTAVQVKFGVLALKQRLGEADAEKQIEQTIKKLQQDPRPAVSKLADQQAMIYRIRSVGRMTEAERKELFKEVMQPIAQPGARSDAFGMAMGLAEMLEQAGHTDLAVAAYEQLAKHAKNSSIEGLTEYAEVFAGTARRLKLPGNTMELTGTTVDGEPFQWDAYRGKFVLVDFWATWCGPCLQELPNVLENYKKYKDKGFEVVGINIDDNKLALTNFLSEEQLPWTTVWEEGHPNAQRYGITAIPTVILVDKAGKVISMNARGPELGRLLEKHLGPAEKE